MHNTVNIIQLWNLLLDDKICLLKANRKNIASYIEKDRKLGDPEMETKSLIKWAKQTLKAHNFYNHIIDGSIRPEIDTFLLKILATIVLTEKTSIHSSIYNHFIKMCKNHDKEFILDLIYQTECMNRSNYIAACTTYNFLETFEEYLNHKVFHPFYKNFTFNNDCIEKLLNILKRENVTNNITMIDLLQPGKKISNHNLSSLINIYKKQFSNLPPSIDHNLFFIDDVSMLITQNSDYEQILETLEFNRSISPELLDQSKYKIEGEKKQIINKLKNFDKNQLFIIASFYPEIINWKELNFSSLDFGIQLLDEKNA